MRSHVVQRTARAPAAQGSLGANVERVTPADVALTLGPLAGMIGYALRRAQLAVFDDAISAFADLDLRLAQFSVLALVGHRPGLKQSAVAAALGIQRANFVALLDSLERRGLARRSPSPSDRRCHALYLTAEGERMLAVASARVAAIEAHLDAKLGPGGHEQLLDMLWRLTRREAVRE
jgi:DNA-binding MarR family transcriptional regulator